MALARTTSPRPVTRLPMRWAAIVATACLATSLAGCADADPIAVEPTAQGCLPETFEETMQRGVGGATYIGRPGTNHSSGSTTEFPFRWYGNTSLLVEVNLTLTWHARNPTQEELRIDVHSPLDRSPSFPFKRFEGTSPITARIVFPADHVGTHLDVSVGPSTTQNEARLGYTVGELQAMLEMTQTYRCPA